MSVSEILSSLSASLGADRVLDREQARQRYPGETSFSSATFHGALRPRSMSELSACVAAACRLGTPLYAISTGNNWGYGAASPSRDGCILLDLGGLSRIREFDERSGVVTLEPGVTQARLHEFLCDGKYPYLIPVTGAGPNCSIVGNAIERGYGITPWVDHFHAVTSVEVMLADGSMYRSPLSAMGAERVDRLFKWGIGPYLDGIFTQSAFGIVTAMSIALARQAESMQCFVFSLKDDTLLAPAVEATRDILAALPGLVGAVNLMNRHRVLAMAAPYPRDRLGPDGLIPAEVLASMGRTLQIFPWTGYGTLYGTQRTTRAARAEIRQRLRGIASRLVFLSPARAGQVIRLLRLLPGPLGARFAPALAIVAKSLELVAGQPNQTALPLAYWRSGHARDPAALNPARDGCGLAWFAPLVPIDGAAVRDYVEFTTATMRRHRLEPLITLTSVNDRCFDSTVPLLFDPAQPVEVERARTAHRQLLDEALAHGLAPYRIGTDAMDWLRASAPEHWQLVRRLKDALDPGGILSPGRYSA
jgi:FAD/FMN-containing dehydrogenase